MLPREGSVEAKGRIVGIISGLGWRKGGEDREITMAEVNDVTRYVAEVAEGCGRSVAGSNYDCNLNTIALKISGPGSSQQLQV